MLRARAGVERKQHLPYVVEPALVVVVDHPELEVSAEVVDVRVRHAAHLQLAVQHTLCPQTVAPDKVPLHFLIGGGICGEEVDMVTEERDQHDEEKKEEEGEADLFSTGSNQKPQDDEPRQLELLAVGERDGLSGRSVADEPPHREKGHNTDVKTGQTIAHQEEKKESVISRSNTLIHPRTMVITLSNAVIACFTVMAPWWAENLAHFAIMKGGIQNLIVLVRFIKYFMIFGGYVPRLHEKCQAKSANRIENEKGNKIIVKWTENYSCKILSQPIIPSQVSQNPQK